MKKETVPGKDEVRAVLDEYLRGILAEPLEWGGGRWYATLLGEPTNPASKCHVDRGLHVPPNEALPEERRIEVFIGEDNIDVITRRADELTNGIAQRLAEMLSRFYDGRLGV